MIGRPQGVVVASENGVLVAEIPSVRCGDVVAIHGRVGVTAARVVALNGSRVTLAPWSSGDGIARGDRVVRDPRASVPTLGTALLGRAIDAFGVPLDGGPMPRSGRAAHSLDDIPIGERRPCSMLLCTGVRAIDGPLAFGRGARIGIFGGPGLGKSQLLATIVRGSHADAVVVGLVGERNREAERWIAARSAHTTIVCATGERPAPQRVRAAEVAFAQACVLRERGLDVLLVVDSLARIAAASREVAVAAGELPGRGGFPPSVFAAMTRLLECAGPTASGSVTLVATILSDGDDERDPVAHAARAALDGHLILCERRARAGEFPAIDVAASASRTIADVAAPRHVAAARVLRSAIAALDESREARALGIATAEPGTPLARAVACEAAIAAFLRQDAQPSALDATLAQLESLAAMLV